MAHLWRSTSSKAKVTLGMHPCFEDIVTLVADNVWDNVGQTTDAFRRFLVPMILIPCYMLSASVSAYGAA